MKQTIIEINEKFININNCLFHYHLWHSDSGVPLTAECKTLT